MNMADEVRHNEKRRDEILGMSDIHAIGTVIPSVNESAVKRITEKWVDVGK